MFKTDIDGNKWFYNRAGKKVTFLPDGKVKTESVTSRNNRISNMSREELEAQLKAALSLRDKGNPTGYHRGIEVGTPHLKNTKRLKRGETWTPRFWTHKGWRTRKWFVKEYRREPEDY